MRPIDSWKQKLKVEHVVEPTANLESDTTLLKLWESISDETLDKMIREAEWDSINGPLYSSSLSVSTKSESEKILKIRRRVKELRENRTSSLEPHL